MLSEHQNKNANFLRILMTLRALRQSGDITEKEYRRAKKYYQNLTGADIVLTDYTVICAVSTRIRTAVSAFGRIRDRLKDISRLEPFRGYTCR